ncbi:MAG: SBBP repeat-containing protein [Planctomycetes bacterium]|nr:SBBP repeat-containing protein [Planctomycetota bacterium]
MKALGALVGSVVLLLGVAVAAQGDRSASASLLKATFGKLPIYFVENGGVYPTEVAYYVQGADKTLFFARDGITFRLKGQDRDWVVKLEFVGANLDVIPRGEEQQEAVFSYFKGPEKDWKTGLRTFSTVVYRDLWPGIDLVYRAGMGALKYEFLVAPGADPGKIRLRYRGASSVTTTEAGALRVETPVAVFEDAPPQAWQEIDGKRVPVEMAYRLDPTAEKEIEFGFDLGDYDPAHGLVLDPAVLVYCGYIGGLADDVGVGIAVDGAGNAYVAGNTGSDTITGAFPVAVGPDLTYNGQNQDAFVAKVNAAGTGLVYCGYIGGSNGDGAAGIAVDGAGNAYVTGWTQSDESTFPVRTGPDLTHNGARAPGGAPREDAFVAKVSTSGTSLVYCGYIGGAGVDRGWSIAVDTSGSAYVSGSTESSHPTFPVVVGPDLTQNGVTDAFVAKVNPQGTALVYCGYVGGAGFTVATGIAVDAAGNAFITGYTNSTEATLPVAVGPDLTYNDNQWGVDGFVAKVTAAGTALAYCGYIGGTSYDWGSAIAVDAHGDAYVVGRTYSTEASFPVTLGPDLTYNGGEGDAFVAKVSGAGAARVYCGYIGGSQHEYGFGVAVDAQGGALVTGCTSSTEATFPVTLGPDLTYNDMFGRWDALVARVSPTGLALSYCGYIGGALCDGGNAIAADTVGNAYVTGCSRSAFSFPVTGGPGLVHAAMHDAFVAKVALVDLQASGWPQVGQTITLHLIATDDAGCAYQVGTSLGPGWITIGNRIIGLAADPLFWVSLGGRLPQVFRGYAGVLSRHGTAVASIVIPNHRALVGLRLHSAFATLTAPPPPAIRSVSNTTVFTIMP